MNTTLSNRFHSIGTLGYIHVVLTLPIRLLPTHSDCWHTLMLWHLGRQSSPIETPFYSWSVFIGFYGLLFGRDYRLTGSSYPVYAYSGFLNDRLLHIWYELSYGLDS
ncbi:hypothetical protein GYMLUDRAFT_616032 [Collybiopsis luxurians FD-317 M1]|uniref:Uncharacterized protein n=1 Tax=Collybiopsis luxurians FD-317 M1 TaxID=944289 RepID=A0A0D0C4N1_9AGAR|nr:hypothetical protein GYMLUDRAFT_616032 [Collybiopsis luxurians FD-317 M1]